MKVTLKTTHYILVIALVNLLFKISLIFRSFFPFSPGMVFNYSFDIVQGCTYLIPLVYLVYLLKFIGQSRSIVIAFAINCLFSAVVMILAFFIRQDTNQVYLVTVGFLSMIILTNLEIQIFRIKHYMLTFPFRVFGITLLAVIFIYVFNAVFLPLLSAQILANKYYLIGILRKTFSLLYVLPQVSIPFILYKTIEFLKQTRPPFEYTTPNIDEQP